MIARGFFHLAQSAAGEEITTYHLQAGLSACHCAASEYETTDWAQILSLYDRLVELDGSPIVALNRAVAVAEIHGPAEGIQALSAILKSGTLENYYLLYAVLGEFEFQLEHFEKAAAHLKKAVELTELKSEKNFLTHRLAQCVKLKKQNLCSSSM
jgi:RNA polymerase sigma-70 factor (ECF subfamily)